MKQHIEFNLDEPDDIEAHKRFTNMSSLYLALWEFDEEMRRQIKYNTEGYNGEQLDALDKLREKFYNILNDNQIKID
jgi:HD-like signal output (HDOD) protein